MKLLAIAVLAIALCFGGIAEANVTKLDEDTVLLSHDLNPPDGEDFARIIRGMVDDKQLNIQFLIDTPGGDFDVMFSIIDTMRAWQAVGVKFTTLNSDIACSAGGYIWLAGDVRQGIRGTNFMFHTAVLFHNIFGLVPWEKVPISWKVDLMESNQKLRQYLLDVLRDTERVNEFLGGGYGAENWFTVGTLERYGLVDQIL